jgi:oligopeptide/dipeptide ABC transporter ATP-binding protein
VSNLTVEFPVERMGALRPVRAVDQVSFSIAVGEVLGLVGESGCGKSMTALSILGLVPPPGRITAGTVEFEGRDLLRLGERDRRAVRGARIGFIFQEPATALNPVFTVGDQIAETLIVHRQASRAEAHRRAVALLDAVRIPQAEARARDYPHHLSGGQRQRVLIAAALACGPSLLIADEPTTALDVTVQAEVLDLLRSMRAELHLSLLIISHDLGVVSDLADRVSVMYAGRIIEDGPARAVLASPLHPYSRGLLASVPGVVAGGRLHAIPGTVPDMAGLPVGCAFAPRCPDRRTECDERRPEPTSPAAARTVRCFVHGGEA